MKACVLTDWQKLEIKEIPAPVPEKDEVLVDVVYGGVCGSDVTVTNHNHLTATVPRILCHEILGRVKEINSEKDLPYKVGDKVCVFPLRYCGECTPCLTGHTSACSHLQIMGVHIDGAFAEYCKAPTNCIIPVPEEIPDRIAALTEPMSVAFHACSRANIQPGEKVLVIGGGPIGLLAALSARYFGGQVLLSEIKEERLELARSLNIRTVNPMAEDFDAVVRDFTVGVGFDKILEVTGSQSGYETMVKAARECATVVLVAIPSVQRSIQPNMFILKELHLLGIRCCPLDEFSRTVTMLSDMFHKSSEYPLEKMITGELPLERTAEGIELQGSGKNNGKILIRIKP